MSKNFIINFALVFIINLLIKPVFLLVIDPAVQNTVGEQAYGTYFSLLSLGFMFNILLDLGTNNYIIRSIAQNKLLVEKYFSKIASIRFLLSFLFAAIVLIIGWTLNYSKYQFLLLLPIIGNQILASLIFFVRSHLAGLHLFKTDSIISALDRFILIMLCSLLLFTNITGYSFSIELFIYCQTFAYSVTLLVAFIVLKSKSANLKFKWNLAFNRVILKKSLPYAVLILLMTFYYRVDGVMLERMLPNGAFEAGIYAKAFRIFEAANNFILLFPMLLLPMFSRMLREKKSINNLLSTALQLMLILTSCIVIFSFFFPTEIINQIYSGRHTDDAIFSFCYSNAVLYWNDNNSVVRNIAYS